MSRVYYSHGLVVITALAALACSSGWQGDESGAEPLQSGRLTIHYGADLHTAKCQGSEVRRDESGKATLLQENGELSFVCLRDRLLGISFGVQDFANLGPTFDLQNDARVSWYANFPVGNIEASLSSRHAETHRFKGTYDADEKHLVAILTANYAATTPQVHLGTLDRATSLELEMDFRAE